MVGLEDLEGELCEVIKTSESDIKILKEQIDQQNRDFIDYKRHIEVTLS